MPVSTRLPSADGTYTSTSRPFSPAPMPSTDCPACKTAPACALTSVTTPEIGARRRQVSITVSISSTSRSAATRLISASVSCVLSCA